MFGGAPNAVRHPQKIFVGGQKLRVDFQADDRLELGHSEGYQVSFG